MGVVTPGWTGRRRPGGERLPPGQYLVTDFPVLSAGPTPRVDLASWEFRVTTETGQARSWDWASFRALPTERITVDLHCVTKWSKLRTPWRGVSVDALLAQVETSAGFALARSYGGYTTNLPVAICSAARPGSRSSTTARRSEPSTAVPRGSWCRTCTCGSRPSG